MALSIGAVGIVTLSQRSWVTDSARDLFPEARLREVLPLLDDIEIVYAREQRQAKRHVGSNSIIRSLRLAHLRTLYGFVTRVGSKSLAWHSLIVASKVAAWVCVQSPPLSSRSGMRCSRSLIATAGTCDQST
eukprot:3410363-Amphidinium_carterae.1